MAVGVVAGAAALLSVTTTTARADGVPVGPTKISIEMSLLEPSGATLTSRRVIVAVGGSENVTVQGGQGRTVSIQATVARGATTGCYKIDLVVRDRRIDSSGHFNKTVWQSATEPCDSEPIVLGPKGETRVRISASRIGAAGTD